MKIIYIVITLIIFGCGIPPQSSSYSKNSARFEVSNPDFRTAISKFNSRRPLSLHENLGSVYVLTNETGLEEVRWVLKNTPLVNNSCHVGTAGWYNFDIISLRKSEYGIIFDYNQNNALFIEMTMKLTVQAKNRQEFVELMIDFLRTHHTTINIDNNDTINVRIRDELTREGSWLSSEQSFKFIKNRIQEGRIASFTNTIINTAVFSKLRGFLDSKNINIDTIYLSNIRVFIDAKYKEDFVRSIEALVQSKSLIINCPALLYKKKENWRRWNLHQLIKNAAYLKGNPNEYFEISLGDN